MDQQRTSILKSMASTVAGSLMEESGRGAIDLMHRLGFLDAEPPKAATPPPRQGVVGIWEPRSDGGFERSPASFHQWGLWCAEPRIPAKSKKKRVLLLGESVARGYFYDPEYTPARVLQSMLETASVAGGVEVVDLAKSDLTLGELVELMRSALVLEPDAVVVFSGNNWFKDGRQAVARSPVECRFAAEILRQHGVAGLKSYLEEKTAALIEEGLRQLAAAAESEGLPLVLLVPEFNLGDWRDGAWGTVPWLSGNGHQLWVEGLAHARDDLAAGRVEEAAAQALELIALDRGVAASGLSLLAQCRRRLGASGEARELLERARDARMWDATLLTPRPSALAQDAMRRLAAVAEGVTLIDLPRVFESRLGGELPDRRFFADYCHLTAAGIQVAMAEAARRTAKLFGGRLPTHELASPRHAPDPRVEGQARLGAAIHSAHWSQPYDVVHHHCVKALEASAAVADVMLHFMELQTRRARPWMCEATERILSLKNVALERYMMRSETQLFDQLLLEAMTSALEQAGLKARDKLDRLRRAERGLAAGRATDLLDPYYATAWDERERGWARNEEDYYFYRAYAPRSEFPFVCREPAALAVTFTCRRPAAAGGGPVRAEFNGHRLEDVAATARWQTWRLKVPPEIVRAGVNQLTIHWPLGTGPGEGGIERTASALERGFYPRCFLPCFGEIHTLTATVHA
jgi:hypothetical protein